MGTPYNNAAGLSPEDAYDPDVMGDGPEAAINGIGYRKADGTLLRFAALKYGSAAENHGYRLGDGRDFSALWAKKGTAVYALPIHGGTFIESVDRTGVGGATSKITFAITGGNAWSLYGTGTGGGVSGGGFGGGSVPAGAVTVSLGWSNVFAMTGGVAPGATTSYSVASNPSAYVQANAAGTIGAANGSAVLTILFYDASGKAISTTTCTCRCIITAPD